MKAAKQTWKWTLTGLAALGMATGVAAQERVHWWSSSRAVPVAAFANGSRLQRDALMLKGVARTVLPMRSLFSALGAPVTWNATDRTVTAWKNDGTGVRFAVGRRIAELLVGDGTGSATAFQVSQTMSLDTPPMLIDGSVYVPVRAATEALGADVRWVGSVPAIYLTTAGGNSAGETTEVPAPETSALTLELPRQTVRSSRSVPIRVRLRNLGNETLTLPNRAGPTFDIQVMQGDRLVWNWARTPSAAVLPWNRQLRAGAATTLNTTWLQRNNRGFRVGPGDYIVRAVARLNPQDTPVTVEQSLRIVR